MEFKHMQDWAINMASKFGKWFKLYGRKKIKLNK